MMTDIPTRPLTAAIVMVCAMLIIGVIDNVIPLLASEIGLWQFHFVRAFMAVPLVLSLSLFGLGTVWPVRLWAVALRSVLIAVSMMFYFTALAILPIAQALAGLFTSPIFILLITAIFLRTSVGPWRYFAVVIGFAGILCVLQPDPVNFDWRILLPVAGGFFYALSAMATRSLCAGESTVALLLGMWLTLWAMGAVGLVLLGLWPQEAAPGPDGFFWRGWVWPMWESMPWVIVQVIGSVSGVFLIIKAYQLGEPSYVAVFEYSVMIFGPVFALVAFDHPIGPWQIGGIALIIVAGAIIALRSSKDVQT